MISAFWDVEHLGIIPNKNADLTQEEDEAVQLMEESTFYKAEEKTWYTSLLFKENIKKLQSNVAGARAVLQKVEKNIIRDNQVDLVNTSYQDMIDGGFAERVPAGEVEPHEGDVHYLQCHPVYKLDRASTKCRIVMNGSARAKNGYALNSCLYQGPCLFPDLVHLLIRFRLFFYVFMLDISKMFLRIKLVHGKDYLRFLWRECAQNVPPEIWRMIVITFGIISSPFQAVFVVRKHAELFKKIYDMAHRSVQESMYMDDVCDGSFVQKEATKMVVQIYQLLLKASMEPHKFASNCLEVLKDIPDKLKNEKTKTKILGIQWDTASDKLTFDFIDKLEESDEEQEDCEKSSLDSKKKVDSTIEKTTKRKFLQQSAKIFDPLGLISPLTTNVKVLFQQLWLQNLAWDDLLPKSMHQQWSDWKTDIKEVVELQKQRCFFDEKRGVPSSIELFAFGDASEKAFATAIYVKGTYKDGTSTSKLVISKTRVTPMTMMKNEKTFETIVRLELLAALITARALKFVQEAILPRLEIANSYCFTDSLINLWRIKNGPDKYKVWVGGRIKEILSTTKMEDWFHCPGTLNPADLPSRGLTAQELINSKLWWEGPDFIHKKKEEWPKQVAKKVEKDSEERKLFDIPKFLTLASNCADAFNKAFDRFETWNKTVRLFAYILRFGSKAHRKFIKSTDCCVEELKMTELHLLRIAQLRSFGTEIANLKNGTKIEKQSKIREHNPQWDFERQILFSETRLVQTDLPEGTKRPIILPKNCKIVDKFILQMHDENGHQGPNYTLSILRQGFRLCQANRQMKRILKKCLKRKCVPSRDLKQQMAPLPALRSDNPASFRNVSVDLFGPLYVKHKCVDGQEDTCPHEEESKVYGALFTCFHSRAIHCELIRGQSTEEFLCSFRMFCARRGTPNVMFSDNAKNFKQGAKEMKALYKSINWSAVANQGKLKSIEWFFNVEKAPWANGLAERMVKSVKTPLRLILGTARLTYRQLSIILTECEAIVNNRPLCNVSDDLQDMTPITPAELIIGRRMEQLPDYNPRREHSDFQHLWKQRSRCLNRFWKRWTNDYLLQQNVRKKWQEPSDEDLLNRVIILKDDQLSRNEWRLGRIIQVFKSKDGLVRTVLVKTQNSELRRPIQRISLLENVF